MNKILFSLFIFSSPLFSDIFPFQTIEKANSAYNKGEFIKSARLFEMLDTKEASVHYNVANAYYKAENYDKALENYIKAKGVEDSIRFYNMGNSYFKKSDFNKAIEYYLKSLNIKDDTDTQYNLLLAEHRAKEQDRKKDNTLSKKKKRPSYNQKIEDTNKMANEELNYLLKQINKKKIPTVMYNINREEASSDKNPW